MCHDIMKQIMKHQSQIFELGKQLGLTARQIHAILTTPRHTTEQLSLSLGPPFYSGGYYGTFSINDFNISKK
jgi:hypothetical protein